MHVLKSIVLFLGRFCIAIIFLASAVGKSMDWDGTVSYMAAKHMTMIPLFLIAAILFEIVGSLSLILGWKARIGSLILMIFLVPTTIIFHDFWNLEGMDRFLQMIEFQKNLAIFGGLLMVLGTGAGSFSVDRCCGKSCPTSETEKRP
jgi:putative oxidoreductase